MGVGNPARGRRKKMTDFSQPNVATRLDRLKYLLKLIQFATEHPDRDDIIFRVISNGVDLALDETKAIALQIDVDMD